jgi:MFS family permease
MSTFYPPYIAKHHPSISDGAVGAVIGMINLGIFVASLTVSQILEKLGRKNILLSGTLLMIAGTVGYGMLVYIEND